MVKKKKTKKKSPDLNRFALEQRLQAAFKKAIAAEDKKSRSSVLAPVGEKFTEDKQHKSTFLGMGRIIK